MIKRIYNLSDSQRDYHFNIDDVPRVQPVIKNSVNREMINRRRILIVDDEPFNVLTLKTMLGQLNIPNIQSIVDQAYNG